VRVLLDTAAFLWLANADRRLSANARAICQDPDSELFLSAVSAWEVALKHSLNRLTLPSTPQQFVPEARERFSVTALAIDEDTALHVGRLPYLHRDPFDRLLVAQAIVHGLVLLTPDESLRRYPARTLW
jgi:PIN domain nuclease of toxin-antitoxin system